MVKKHYVYVLTDPRDGRPFYIGMGVGKRAVNHLKDKNSSVKVRRIAEIRRSGYEPEIDVLSGPLTKEEAELVEASAIDLIGLKNLTNVVCGHHHQRLRRMKYTEYITRERGKAVKVAHNVVLIKINEKYYPDMTDQELYEATRGVWKINPSKKNPEYAMAVYRGVIKEVYKIDSWHPGGTTSYSTRRDVNNPHRKEFVGSKAPEDVRKMYVGKFIENLSRNPIRYRTPDISKKKTKRGKGRY